MEYMESQMQNLLEASMQQEMEQMSESKSIFEPVIHNGYGYMYLVDGSAGYWYSGVSRAEFLKVGRMCKSLTRGRVYQYLKKFKFECKEGTQ